MIFNELRDTTKATIHRCTGEIISALSGDELDNLYETAKAISDYVQGRIERTPPQAQAIPQCTSYPAPIVSRFSPASQVHPPTSHGGKLDDDL